MHRLDTNTTGLIAFAKTEYALAELTAAFRDSNALGARNTFPVGSNMVNYAMVDFYLVSFKCKQYNVRRLGEMRVEHVHSLVALQVALIVYRFYKVNIWQNKYKAQ